MSSEAKHTPLPWRIVGWHGEHDEAGCAIGSVKGEYVLDIRGSGNYPKDDANASLVVSSVNARPKVEELVGMIASYQDRILKKPTDVDSYPTAADIFAKNREVEAALKGETDG